MNKPKCYISGPISDCLDFNRPAFARVEGELEALGFHVINPHKVHAFPPGTVSWLDYIIADLEAMRDCTMVVFLPHWQLSHGARIEEIVARKLGMLRIYPEE